MLEVIKVSKSFGGSPVLREVSLELNQGEVCAVIGPSGSGKSTLLRCIIDLEKADSGEIIIEGEFLCRDGRYPPDKQLRALRSKLGMVFQHFNLFPHMTVRENLLCAPRLLTKEPLEYLEEKCLQTLIKVGLENKINESVAKLSGGMKQRVAIARALMLNPDIMLFDEPTSALDPELTSEVLNVIKDLAKEKMTMLVVTHEMGFAREAAQKIVFMDNGQILANGAPSEILDASDNKRIQAFLAKVL